jgi:hypothetical protein
MPRITGCLNTLILNVDLVEIKCENGNGGEGISCFSNTRIKASRHFNHFFPSRLYEDMPTFIKPQKFD